MLFHKPKITVCIPLFNTEEKLLACLESVKNQSFEDFEIVLVNDGSCGCDKTGRNAQQIVKDFIKSAKNEGIKINLNYIVHSENKGLLEARRTAIYAAKGEYIFNLDSDDTIPENALEILYQKAKDSGADIVQGKGKIVPEENVSLESIEQMNKKVQKVYCGELKENQILRGYLIDQNHHGFLWGQLIKKEVYLNAFNYIPPTFCIMGEDLVQYFFLCYEAKSYLGIDAIVYDYSISGGITSNTKITDLSRWEKVCSTASVFTVLVEAIQNGTVKIQEDELENIKDRCRYFLLNNLIQWEKEVEESIKNSAYELLCEYWGTSFVDRVYNELKKMKEEQSATNVD